MRSRSRNRAGEETLSVGRRPKPMARPGLVRVFLFSVLVACFGCGGGEKPKNVILIVVDTLRPDRLGCYGADRNTSPSIDAFAREAVIFDRAYATAPWTLPSTASMLTGLYPSTHQATSVFRELSEETPTLPGVFRSFGYECVAVVSQQLVGVKFGIAKDFDECDESGSKGQTQVSTPEVTRKARNRLHRLSRSDRPFFLFVHYFDPHYMYLAHPEYGFATSSAGRLDGTELWRDLQEMEASLEADEARFLSDRYDEEICFTDAGVGSLLATLDDLGLDGNTVIVFTSDHGEEFLEHGGIGHASALYEESVRVPLMIRSPGIPGGARVEAPVSLAALPSTILDLAGVDPSALGGTGKSLTGLLRGGEEPDALPVFFEVENSPFHKIPEEERSIARGLVLRNGKIIFDEASGEWERYDLAADPEERENRIGTDPIRDAELKSELERIERIVSEGASGAVSRDLSEEDRELLEGLGYIDTD